MNINFISIFLFTPVCIAGCSNDNPSVSADSIIANVVDTPGASPTNVSIPEITWDEPSKPIETHLRDTEIISGNVILFLRPDDERFASFEQNRYEGIYEVDSDFGVGITNTFDSLAKNKKYEHIKADVTAKRFVSINDCNTCPLTIDRDTVSYGYIMSSIGRGIITSSEVHSGNYLMDVDEYFELDDQR